MPYKVVDSKRLLKEYKRFCDTKTVNEDQLEANHMRIRKFFIDNYYPIKNTGYNKYNLDLELGLRFYQFMESERDFTNIYRSDYDFWRYIAVYDIPDIVADRFGIDNDKHFYAKSTRVYPYILYWYIHMSWQGSIEATRSVLKGNTTDEILQVVERPSRIGVNLDLFRMMMKKYSLIPKDKRRVVVGGKEKTIFRVVLMKNTSKLTVLRPELYPTGIEGYVKMLFGEYANLWRES